MAAKKTQQYGTYDRVLDWFSDHRQTIAKVCVLVAVVAMVGTGLIAALLS